MPPKKKEEEIDLATLPPWASKNALVVCSGLKGRSTAILQTLKKEANKYVKYVTRNDIVEHAKEKGLYVDPNTLTDKQKKDTKFMSEVSTELTGEVLAKATASLIANVLNAKYRIEKKNKLEGKDEAKEEDNKKAGKKEAKKEEKKEEIKVPPVEQKQYNKNFDSVYIFEGYPSQKEEYVELAKLNESISYVVNIKPVVTLPKPAEEEEEDQEEAAKLKQLREKESPTEADRKHQQEVDEFITSVSLARKYSPQTSEVRNLLIRDMPVEIDPATEQQTLKGLPEAFFEFLCELSVERAAFDEWLRSRHSAPLVSKSLTEEESKSPPLKSKQSKTPLSLLLDMAHEIQQSTQHEKLIVQANQNIQVSIDKLLNATPKELSKMAGHSSFSEAEQNIHNEAEQNFVHTHDWHAMNSHQPHIEKEILSWLRYPGIHRVMMPDQPEKSKGLRKREEAEYVNFVEDGTFEGFQRANRIIFFEKMISTADEFRAYDFGDRSYEERLDRKSLTDAMHEALLEHPELVSRYNAKDDCLYVGLLHRKPPGGLLQKKWVADWRVLPNFENWMNYFRNNESNLKATDFYDIDYETLSNLNESNRVVYPEDNSMIVVERRSVGGAVNANVRITKNKLTMGVDAHGSSFWYHHQNVRLTVENHEGTLRTYLTLSNGLVIVLEENGQVYQKIGSEPGHLTMPSGHCILFNKGSQLEVLHPNGGLTYPPFKYTTKLGYGKEKDTKVQIPTLQRTTSTHNVIKRDDDTVIVHNGETEWIRFHDGTEIQRSRGEIVVEYGELARWSSIEGGFKVSIQDLNVVARKLPSGKYNYNIGFSNDSEVVVSDGGIYCLDGAEKARYGLTGNSFQPRIGDIPAVYHCSLKDKVISTENNKIRVHFNGIIEQTKGNNVVTIDDGDLNEQEIKAQLLSPTYIQPRLFEIYPNDTGVQLLSEKQVAEYKRQINLAKSNAVTLEQGKFYTFATDISPKGPKRVIRADYPSGLDVIQAPPTTEDDISDNKRFELRILEPKESLDETTRQHLHKVQESYEQWKAEQLKQNNEYGFTELTPEVIQQAVKEKERMIQHRRMTAPQNPNPKRIMQLKSKISQQQEQELQRRLSKKQSEAKPDSESKPEKAQFKAAKRSARKQPTEALSPISTVCFNFFATEQGKKVLQQMPDWVFKPKQKKEKAAIDIEEMKRPSGDSDLRNVGTGEEQLQDQLRQSTGQQPQSTMPNLSPSKILIKPSVFTQQDIEEERLVFEQEKKAFEYREIKRKDFDVYGRQRADKPVVASMMRTQPISELNQKYILTEAMTDKKIRIASMKNKLTTNAPAVSDLRNEGLHHTLMRSIDMANAVEDQSERKNLMIYAELNDKLRRDILVQRLLNQISPTQANFGVVKENATYELKLQIKNEDVLCQRIAVKRPRTNFVKAYLNEMGPIPLGISRKVIVQLRTTSDLRGKFSDDFQIVSKHEIYKIPVVAQIVSEEAFLKQSQKESSSRSMLRPGVSEVLPTVLKASRASQSELLPKIDK